MIPRKQPTRAFYRRMRGPLLGSIAAIISLGMPDTSWAQAAGEAAFNTTCIACHTIGGGRLIGPDLAGVTDRRSDGWLASFIKSSQSMIDSGDPDAVALAGEYAGLVMPDAAMSDQQIADIIGYLKAGQPAEQTTASAPAAPPQSASEENILAGQHYFQGERRFENGGAACNACHDVRNDAVIGGGVLAAELTTVFSRMGSTGVRVILGQAPFPVMQAAYKEKPLTEAEVTALVAFLQFADSEEYNQLPRDYGIGLFLTGSVGGGLMFAFFGVVWRGRKRGSVNQAIYDRQITSQSDDGSA
jgi:cytochrome c2